MFEAPAPTDDVLLAAAAAGDHGAFEQLLRRHGDVVWSLALRALGGDRAAAEAAVEHAWGEAWASVADQDPAAGVEEWLFATVVRSCEQVLPPWQSDPPPAPVVVTSPDGPDGPAEPWERLSAGLSRLPWSQRVAWLLVEVHDLEPRRAARVLAVPDAVLGELLVAARADLTRHVRDL